MDDTNKVLAAIEKLRNDIVQAIKDSEQRIIDRIDAGKLELRSATGSEQTKPPYKPGSILGQVMGESQPSPFDTKKDNE